MVKKILQSVDKDLREYVKIPVGGDVGNLQTRVGVVESSLAQKALQTDLNTTNANLGNKVDKNGAGQVTLEMLSQTAREAMTGGSVAVVGNKSVGMGQFNTTIQNDIGTWAQQTLSIISGTHYRTDTGYAVANTSSTNYYSAILPASSGDRFKVNTQMNSVNAWGVIFVDDNMLVLGSILQGTGSVVTYTDYEATAPSGTTKAIFCAYGSAANLSSKKIQYSSIASKDYVDTRQSSLFSVNENVTFSDWEIGGIGTSGANNTLTTRIRTIGYYQFQGTLTITPNTGYKFCIFTYDANKAFVSYEWVTTSKAYTVNSSYYYRFCIANTSDGAADTSFSSQVTFNSQYSLPSYKDTVNTVNTVKNLGSSNVWSGKTIVFQGDSITDESYNSDITYNYPTGVFANLGFKTKYNYGISGSTIAINPIDTASRNPIIARYQSMNNTADVVVVAAGTNDWYYTWSPLGNMTSRDSQTFYGALHNLCLGLLKMYKGKTIMFMTPIMRRQGSNLTPESVNGNGKTLKEYGDIIKEVCTYYGIPVLDMYHESSLYPFDDELAIYYYKQQGTSPDFYYTHPNAEGHKLMAKRLTGYLRQLA